MHAGEKRLLISMVEEVYMDQRYTSFASAVYKLSHGFELSDEELFRKLKREFGMRPTGRISRVVSKRVYESCERSGDEVVSIVKTACAEAGRDAREVSDDLLCRQLE